MKTQTFDLIYAPLVKSHLKAIESKYYSVIRETIAAQLQTEPEIETGNRKPLKRPMFGATWELRLGPNNRFRVLYKVDPDERQAYILAIGVKQGARLWIGGEEIKL